MKQYFTKQYWKGQRLLLLAFLLVHIVVAAVHISMEGITVDEPDYYTYAARWAHGNVERDNPLYDSKSPVVAVALIPRIVKQIQHPNYKATDNGIQDVKDGRPFMVIYTIIIAIYLFVWIRRLFGAKAWILPVLFFLFDPTIISFSMIITSDMATGACLVATMYHLFRFYEERQRKHFLAFAQWLGISFVCKASLLFLLPCLVLLYVLLLLAGNLRFKLKPLLVYGSLTLVIAVTIINLAYFGKHTLHSLDQIQFFSSAFKSLASSHLINKIPVPVPANYVASLDLLLYHAEIGAGKLESSYPGVFVNGNLKHHGGFWYYYLFTGFYKIPISILLLVVIGIVTLLLRLRYLRIIKEYIWFVWPALFFFFILSFFNPLQIGFRHFLLIYPLLFIGIAAVLKYWESRFKYATPTAWLFFGYMLICVGSYFPNLIAYTNEILWDKKNAFRKIRDSSIDYGQNENSTTVYLAVHPDVQIPPNSAKPGKYVVQMVELLDEGPVSPKKKYLWLLDFEPVDHYKYTMFIFNISAEDIASQQQKSPAK